VVSNFVLKLLEFAVLFEILCEFELPCACFVGGCVCMYMCVCVGVCVCACASVRERVMYVYIHTRIFTYMHP